MWRGRGVSATLTLFDKEDTAVIKKYAIGLLAACAAVMSHADVMWGKAAAGDSLEAVKAAHPGGQEVPPDEKNVVARTGAMMLYQLQNVPIGAHKFTASFSFKENSLAQVTLATKFKSNERTCTSEHRGLIDALTTKYGKPISADPQSTMRRTVFQSGATTITAVGLDSPGGECWLNIFYTSELAENAKNL